MELSSGLTQIGITDYEAKVLRSGLEKLYTTIEDDRVWSISGREPTVVFKAQMISHAKEEIYTVLNNNDLNILQ